MRLGDRIRRGYLVLAALLSIARPDVAQQRQAQGGVVTGRVVEAGTREPLAGVLLGIEGTILATFTDSAGRYRLSGVPLGPQVLVARRIGFAPTRIPFTATAAPRTLDLALARRALELPGVIVTATPEARARGELGTATVVDRDAIANQAAASLQGVLELTPGVVLSPPGLDAVQQISLRAGPTGFGAVTGVAGAALGPTGADLAAFGTLIILDNVPLSNNANLQSTGPRGELSVPSSAGGGIDLRRIPAATLDRVEVIRGIPSARYGDLTQGVIVVETRAGVVAPDVIARFDYRTAEASLVGGRALGDRHLGTASLDVAHTRIQPGLRDDDALRVTAQLAHRAVLGPRTDTGGAPGAPDGRLVLDSRLDFFRLFEDNPEDKVFPGHAARSHDNGLRLSERARLALGGGKSATLTLAMDRTSQRSYTQDSLVRPATPFTDRLTAGRQTGHFIFGPYLARVNVSGDPWLVYGRLETDIPGALFGFEHRLRAGAELRREWNAGPGYQFDIEFPPQVRFNGVQGFDRPRRYDAIPPVVTSALYLDDRLIRALPGGASLDLQAGLRLDLLHWGTHWLRAPRDAVLQPRVNLQVAPRSWLRLRGGIGRTAKLPSIGSLYPAPQYYDVVNVNWYANNPAERLAVLTTFMQDPTNADLGFSVARKAEAGAEVGLGAHGASIALVAFSDRIAGGVGFRSTPGYYLREHFDLSDSTQGTGVPPTIVEPAAFADTVPVLLDQPANVLDLTTEGWELTASLPEIRPLRTRLEIQGAWLRTRFARGGLDFGLQFSDFQLNGRVPRAPYWDGASGFGRRTVLTARLLHHEPALGLVITVTTQFLVNESTQDVAGEDTLAFAGYITRAGVLVPVPLAQRGDSQYADIRQPRSGLLTARRGPPDDWLLSLQVSKTLPLDGRLSFFAFNAFDRPGRFGAGGTQRIFQPVRFGLELTMPVRALWGRGR